MQNNVTWWNIPHYTSQRYKVEKYFYHFLTHCITTFAKKNSLVNKKKIYKLRIYPFLIVSDQWAAIFEGYPPRVLEQKINKILDKNQDMHTWPCPHLEPQIIKYHICTFQNVLSIFL